MAGQILMGALAPHPPIVVPEVGGREIRKVAATQDGLRVLGHRAAQVSPEVLVMFSPHAPLAREGVPLLEAPRLRGDLALFGAPHVSMEWRVDGELLAAIREEAVARGVPTVTLAEERVRRFAGSLLDHGLAVPLYYLRQAGVECPLVATGISPLPWEELVRFGQAVAAAIGASGRKAVVIASGDLSHRLTPGAPAGFDPAGREFDDRVVAALRAGDLGALLTLDEDLVDRAGECGLRPLFMLLGALQGSGLRARVVSYEGPFGVGYAVVTWTPPPSWPVSLALESLEHYLHRGAPLKPPADVPEDFRRRAGVFVSFKKAGDLRGCIGTIEPTRATLAEEIIYNAISAGTRDPRFTPITPEEIPYLDCSVDILEEPEPVEGYGQLDPSRYGVIVRKGWRTGLLLPDLEGVDTVEQQVAIAKQKAGIRPDERDVELLRFRVTRYH
ncbi:MAG: AmmeMemoRadiSam system protein A [Bacillota bacterium]